MEQKDCIFCKIGKGDISHERVYEDKDVIAFLDAFPCVEGQTLVIPKKHVGYFVDLDDNLYKKLMLASKKIAGAMQKAFNPIKVGVIIEGLEVNHVHIKLYPLSKGGFAEVISCKPKISEKGMKEIAEKIKKFL
jgi:histidine triad (HIT) family protein